MLCFKINYFLIQTIYISVLSDRRVRYSNKSTLKPLKICQSNVNVTWKHLKQNLHFRQITQVLRQPCSLVLFRIRNKIFTIVLYCKNMKTYTQNFAILCDQKAEISFNCRKIFSYHAGSGNLLPVFFIFLSKFFLRVYCAILGITHLLQEHLLPKTQLDCMQMYKNIWFIMMKENKSTQSYFGIHTNLG